MSRKDRLQTAAQGYIDREEFSGIEWHVETRGEQLTTGRAGVAEVSSGKSIPDGAIYRIYSMTKPIVSVMAMILIEQGKLRLYDMLPQFNPAFRNMRVLLPSGELESARRPILVEDLFTHRAGFSYEFIAGCHIAPGYDAMDDTDYFIPESKQDRLMTMYGVSDVKDMSFLNPPEVQELILSDVEEMYPSTNPEYSRGGHGLFSTTDDYLKFGRMLLTGKSPGGEVILSRKMLEMMRSNRIPESQLPLRIGLSALPGYGWGL